MPKRFTTTEIWKDSWFRKLPTKFKEAWRFLYENCDMAGVWKVDIEAMQFFINGEIFDEQTLLQEFNNGKVRVTPFDNGNLWFLNDFIKFQYGNLSIESSTHRGVLKVLDVYFEKGLGKGYVTIKAKAKDKAKAKEDESAREETRWQDPPVEFKRTVQELAKKKGIL